MKETFVSKQEVRGTASGVLFMAFFGTAWAGIGIGGLQGWGTGWLVPSALGIGILFLIGGFTLMWQSRNLSGHLTKEGARRGKRIGIAFGITFGTEGAFIAAASIICNVTNHFEYFFPIMALIVGVHFFPLAPLFRVWTHYLTGTLLCLLAIATLLFMPQQLHMGNHQIDGWWTLLGFGSAIILWGTGILIWLIGKKLLNKARNMDISANV